MVLASGGGPIVGFTSRFFRVRLAGRIGIRTVPPGFFGWPSHIRLSKIAARFPSSCSHDTYLLFELLVTIRQNSREVVHKSAFSLLAIRRDSLPANRRNGRHKSLKSWSLKRYSFAVGLLREEARETTSLAADERR